MIAPKDGKLRNCGCEIRTAQESAWAQHIHFEDKDDYLYLDFPDSTSRSIGIDGGAFLKPSVEAESSPAKKGTSRHSMVVAGSSGSKDMEAPLVYTDPSNSKFDIDKVILPSQSQPRQRSTASRCKNTNFRPEPLDSTKAGVSHAPATSGSPTITSPVIYMMPHSSIPESSETDSEAELNTPLRRRVKAALFGRRPRKDVRMRFRL